MKIATPKTVRNFAFIDISMSRDHLWVDRQHHAMVAAPAACGAGCQSYICAGAVGRYWIATAANGLWRRRSAVSETRKLAAILVTDVVGYSRLAGADEDRILARLRTLRSDLIDPTIAVHHGRVVKRTGDGAIVEFRSLVDAVRCGIEVQNALIERNAGLPEDRRIQFRVGIHVGDVVEESDGDLMGDGVNIAARLQGVAKPGAICLSEQAYWQVKGRLDLKVIDLGPVPLKNIAEAVHVYSVEVGDPTEATPTSPASRGKPGPPRLSIVVLPFAIIGGDPEQGYFVDGVTESLTTDLSRISGAFVIGRSTAFTYKGKAVDLKQIGRDLNVRYVLEGSVQRGSNRVRVNVQLIDAEIGNHVWADRFEKPVADLMDMQDEIVARLANTLNAQLMAAEARRAERAPNPDSMDLYFQGMAWINSGTTPEHMTRAHGFFERALELDPRNVEALVGTASVDVMVSITYMTDDQAARLASAEAALARALSLAPEHALAHLMMGRIQVVTNRAALGIAECERALALDRNLADAHAVIGLAKIFSGHPEETEAHVNEALRLSPHDHRAYRWIQFVGTARLHLGRDEEAVACSRRSIEINRNHPITQFYLAAALAHLGRLEEAQSAVRAGLTANPSFTISRFRAAVRSDNASFLAQRERLYEGMRKAGVPEGAKKTN
jgi:TolB-like protein/class 3 adenylate cyclase/Tfp pilus assembly protein PilF